ncbi:MAG: 7-carboxy-7-deazaguanine synthase QueE [Bacteroidia bacterium]|nr:7-carboxy-7-deazaguanine synthase QueE [Bacteroidia bacterium]
MTDIFEGGNKLPVTEEFYSLQGEGYNTGKAAYFIRIGGCDICCSWCDSKITWNSGLQSLTDIKDIIDKARAVPAKAVVVTGGEPLMYNLDPLCEGLKKHSIKTFIETSGSHPISGTWDWICLSPKKQTPPLNSIYSMAHELKVVIFDEDDFDRAEENSRLVNKKCKLYLQPEWSRYRQNILVIVEYIKAHPYWSISLQAHKFMRIP